MAGTGMAGRPRRSAGTGRAATGQGQALSGNSLSDGTGPGEDHATTAGRGAAEAALPPDPLAPGSPATLAPHLADPAREGDPGLPADTGPSATAEGPRVDWSGALRQVAGDPLLLQRVVGAFLEETPRILNELAEGAEQGAWDRVRRGAHTLKGGAEAVWCRGVAHAGRNARAGGPAGECCGGGRASVVAVAAVRDAASRTRCVCQEGRTSPEWRLRPPGLEVEPPTE